MSETVSKQMRRLARYSPILGRVLERLPLSPARMRSAGLKLEMRAELASGVSCEETTIAGLPAIRMSSGNAARGTVLYLHGGAYIAGSRYSARSMSGVCADGGPDMLSLEYRMGPEHPYPAAVDDALAAYKELVETVGAQKVVVMGESAGGGLTLALLQTARDAGLPMPAAAVPVFPWADLTQTSASMLSGPMLKDSLTVFGLTRAASWYAGGRDVRTPGMSPVFGSFAGMPPMLIHVGLRDRLLDDARTVAAALRNEGGEVTLKEIPGTIHGFTGFKTPETVTCKQEIRDFVLAALPG